MAAITICSDFGAPQKIKSDTVSTVSPSISHEVVRPDAMILVFWMLSFKPIFSFYSFTFIKRLFSSSLLSAIRVVSSAYLRLLIFLPVILIPACASSSPGFLMMWFMGLQRVRHDWATELNWTEKWQHHIYQRCRVTRIFIHFWWERKMVQLHWNTVWHCLNYMLLS